jgi:hypothetical protein
MENFKLKKAIKWKKNLVFCAFFGTTYHLLGWSLVANLTVVSALYTIFCGIDVVDYMLKSL